MFFRGEYGFLSNFYNTSITYKGITYQNAESAFQAQKCNNEADRQKFISLSGKEAKQLGRKVRLRKDWEEIKLLVMEEIVESKFVQHPELMKKLVKTMNIVIEEENYWGDIFWGTVNGVGKNHLGIILMKVRDKYRQSISLE